MEWSLVSDTTGYAWLPDVMPDGVYTVRLLRRRRTAHKPSALPVPLRARASVAGASNGLAGRAKSARQMISAAPQLFSDCERYRSQSYDF